MPLLEVLAPMALQGATQAFNDWQVNRQNKELAQYTFNKNLQMWRMNNEYNSPVNQMARLKAAGLNPNLVYGNGAVANSSSKTPEMETPHVQSTLDLGNPLEHLERYQNTRIQQQQEANLAAQEQLIKNQALKAKADAIQSGIRSGILKHDRAIRGIQAKFAEELTATQRDMARQQLTNAEKQEAILKLEQQIKQIELDLRRKGFSPNDPAWIRTMGTYWDAIMSYGLDEDDLPRRLLDRYNDWRRNNNINPEPSYRHGTVRQ